MIARISIITLSGFIVGAAALTAHNLADAQLLTAVAVTGFALFVSPREGELS
jgi:hypothetical protein